MESCDYKVCGGDSIPFAQWSPETLGAGFVLPFALTNSECLPSALPTGETLPSFAAAAAGSFPSFRIAEIRSTRKGHFGFLCRSGGIRTRGLLVPNQTRYQTALHLDTGADEGTRTPDLLITNRLLYQLSHIGTTSKRYYNKGKMVCPALFLRAGSTSDQWTDKPLYAKLLRNRNLPDPAGSTAEGTNHEL